METQKGVKNCDPDNRLDYVDCFKDFVTDKMGCSVPWGNHPKSDKSPCKTQEELREYLNLRLKIFQAKHQDELEVRGCISKTLTNCQKTFWPYQDGGEVLQDVADVVKHTFQLDLDVSSKDILLYVFFPKRSVSYTCHGDFSKRNFFFAL